MHLKLCRRCLLIRILMLLWFRKIIRVHEEPSSTWTIRLMTKVCMSWKERASCEGSMCARIALVCALRSDLRFFAILALGVSSELLQVLPEMQAPPAPQIPLALQAPQATVVWKAPQAPQAATGSAAQPTLAAQHVPKLPRSGARLCAVGRFAAGDHPVSVGVGLCACSEA